MRGRIRCSFPRSLFLPTPCAQILTVYCTCVGTRYWPHEQLARLSVALISSFLPPPLCHGLRRRADKPPPSPRPRHRQSARPLPTSSRRSAPFRRPSEYAFSFLVFAVLNASQVNTPASSRLEDPQPPENTASQRPSSSPQTTQTIQSILTASNDPSEASSSTQPPPWNAQPAMGHPPREPHGSLPGTSAPSQVSARPPEAPNTPDASPSAPRPSANSIPWMLTTPTTRLDASFATMLLRTRYAPYP